MDHRARQPETPATTARVYYFPEFAAEGGPPPNGPVMSPHTFLEDTASGVALVYLADENLWALPLKTHAVTSPNVSRTSL